jgi:flagellar motor switch protein FliN
MMEATAPARQPEAREFLEIWGDSFSRVVEQITGAATPYTVLAETSSPADRSSAELSSANLSPTDLSSANPPSPGEGDLWVVVTSSGALRGEMSVRLASTTILRMAQILRGKQAIPEAQPAADHAEANQGEVAHADAVVELLRQVSGLVSTAAKARWGEIQLRVEAAATAPSWSSAGTFRLQAGAEGPAGMVLEVGLSAALVAGLRVEHAEAARTDTAKVSMDSSPAVTAAVAGQSRGALDMLMDVQLAMTLRFGTRRLLLREVLDLSPGAVVELDRGVNEPVDLLLDGRLVARGEVVVVDGNYGLRVTDMSPLGAS